MLLAVWTRIVRNDRPVSTEALSRCTIASRLSAEEHLAYTQAKIANAMAERDRLLRLKDNKNAAAMEALSVEDLDQRLAANAALLEETE